MTPATSKLDDILANPEQVPANLIPMRNTVLGYLRQISRTAGPWELKVATADNRSERIFADLSAADTANTIAILGRPRERQVDPTPVRLCAHLPHWRTPRAACYTAGAIRCGR